MPVFRAHFIQVFLLSAVVAVFGLSCTRNKHTSADLSANPALTDSLAAGTQTASPSNQVDGTADGSGGDTPRSGVHEIDKLIFNPNEPHLSLKKRLSLAFYRIAVMGEYEKKVPGLDRYFPPPHETDITKTLFFRNDPLFKVFYEMFTAPMPKDLFQSIDDLKFAPQSQPCKTTDGQHTDMAIAKGKVCISTDRLKNIPPESLKKHVFALMAHEFAHERGVTSELIANRIRDYFINNESGLTGDSPITISVQDRLARLLPSTELLGKTSPQSIMDANCHELYSTLETMNAVDSEMQVKNFMHQRRGTEWFTDAGRELDSGYCRTSPVLYHNSLKNPHLPVPANGVKSFWENINKLVIKAEALRQENIRFTTPFFRWENAISHNSGRSLLLYNAVRPMLKEDGQLLSNIQDVTPKAESLRCKVDGEPLVFSSQNCPTITDLSKDNLNGNGPVVENGSVEQDLKCARKELFDSKGKSHTLHFFAGDYTFHNLDHATAVPGVLAVQVLLNYEKFKESPSRYQELVQNYSGFIRVEGKDLLSTKNNVALLDYTHFTSRIPRSHGLFSVLHPKNAPGFDVSIHLPVSFDSRLESVMFERPRHRLECEL